MKTIPLWMLSDQKASIDASHWDDYWSSAVQDKDEFIRDRKFTAEYLFRHLQLHEDGLRCLDLAGGGGGVSYSLLELNPSLDVTIADISLAKAQTLIGNRASYLMQDATRQFPHDIGSFDRIWICELEYLLTDKQWTDVVQRCGTLLKPGGLLGVTSAAVFNFFKWTSSLAKLAWKMTHQRMRPVSNGVCRPLWSHRRLVMAPGLTLVKEEPVKLRSSASGFRFGYSDCEIYGFILKKTESPSHDKE